MRKPLLIGLSALVIVLVGATSVLYARYRKTTEDYVNMKAAEETTRARYDRTIDAIAEIQDSLNAISIGEGNLTSRSLESEKNLSGQRGQETLDRIAQLRASITRSRDRIRQLESMLHKSGIKVAGLQRMITNLKQSVQEKQDLVASLTERVDVLQTQVTGLETTVHETQDTLRVRDETLEQRRREMATVFYTVGSRKDLANRGVIVAKGGLLGLGKTLQPTGTSEPTAYTPMDTDQETVIPISASKARVLSAQPPASYELVQVEGRMELHILNPSEFRKVKHVVILTA